MVRRVYYRDDEGDIVEMTGRLPREGWEVAENAEEGSTAMSTLPLDDPDMDWDLIGHRQFRVLEDESEADDDVLYFGFVADQVYGRQGAGDLADPIGRVVGLSVVDGNSLWGRRVLVGSDCKRPAETDVERMTWLVGTEEMGYFDDLTLLASGSPVNMDAVDYRGQMVQQCADDCAQASGKNWWIGMRSTDGGSTHDIFVWYGKESLTTYASPLYLSNDPADWDDAALEDGTSLVWPISYDTTLRRDPGRVYSGVYLPYQRGAIYRKDAATMAQFALSGRDMVAPSLNVKSKTKAEARAARYLADLDEQDERVTTTVVLPKGKATMLRAGMRVQFKATHLPGYEESVWMRVLTCAIAPVAAGTKYRLTLELSGPGAAGYSCSTALLAAVSDTDMGLESGTTGSSVAASVSTTATAAGYALTVLLGCNGNTPNAENMANPSGWTAFDNQTDFSRSTWSFAYKAVTAGAVSASANFSAGFNADGEWIAGIACLPWAGLTVVQEVTPTVNSSTGTFASPVTPGNTVLMLAVTGGQGTITPGSVGPTTGWTTLFDVKQHHSNADAHVQLFARCVSPGDGDTYDYGVTNATLQSNGCYLVEIAT